MSIGRAPPLGGRSRLSRTAVQFPAKISSYPVFLTHYFDLIFLELLMAIERTLSIIKPDAVAKNVIGKIYSRFEDAGLTIIAARMMHLSRAEAEGFYAVHKERPFFKDLVGFMIS